jgi:pimeloyl-ACP methyl ester carboxylesterase
VALSLARIGDRDVGYARRGSGEPLLLVEGMAMHHLVWGEPFLAALGEHYDVISYDHRGIGDSADVAGEFSIAVLAEDAAALLDALDIESAHVFGISMGGMVAQELALINPQRVRTLALGCTYAGGEGSTLVASGPMRMFEAMQTHDPDIAVRAGFEANLSPAFCAGEGNWERFHELALAQRVPVPVIMRQAQAAMGHDTSTRLPGLTVPTLVLHGTLDEMLAFSNGERIAALIPGSTFVAFDEVGHLFWWERHDESLAALRAHAG